MIKRQRFSSNRGSRCLFCLADGPTLLPAAPRFLSHASFIKEQVLLHDACFQPELRERVLPGKLVPDEPFDPDIHRHTAHTAMIGALTIIMRPMVMNIWICVMSFVERVMSDAVEKRFISAGPKLSTLLNSSERRRWLNEAPTRAAM